MRKPTWGVGASGVPRESRGSRGTRIFRCREFGASRSLTIDSYEDLATEDTEGTEETQIKETRSCLPIPLLSP